MLRRLVVPLVIGLAAAAVVAPAHAADGSTSDTRGPGDFTGTVKLANGRGVDLTCRGRGTPTVMLEGGLHATADVWIAPNEPTQTEETVFPALATTTRVCAYDRPGTAIGPGLFSRSDPVRMPRSTGDIVNDLRALQRAARIPGPYVFVGHSMGRLIARQYTSLYPKRVAGLVLVEAIPETMETDLSVADWNGYDQLLLAPVSGIGDYPNVETVDFRQSFAQMRRAGVTPPRRIPSIVISRGKPAGIPGQLDADVEAAWAEGQDYLARMQPGTPHVTSTNSDHEIEFEDPKIVIDSARRVIDAVRQGRSSVG